MILITGMFFPQIMAIKNLEKEFKSKIEVHQGSRLNRIVVEGDLKNLTPCIGRIVAILHKIQAEHIEQENANLIYQQVICCSTGID